MAEKQTRYKSFLLRLWREGEASDNPWRATLEPISEKREQCHFPDMESLLLYLLAETEGD